MFSVEEYLTRLGYSGSTEPTVPTLRELHKRHLMTVPFDNTLHAAKGLAAWDDVETDVNLVFDEVVRGGRGGICHELNGLFRTLLRELGFELIVLGAAIRGADNRFGLDLEHMLNAVRIDGVWWLADVGYVGPSFVEPLRLADEVQHQYGFDYKVIDDGDYHVVQRKAREGDWQSVLRFKLQDRELKEWIGFADRAAEAAAQATEDWEWNWQGEDLSAGTIIQGRSFDGGQMILIGKRYVEARDGRDEMRVLVDPAKRQAAVDRILGRAG